MMHYNDLKAYVAEHHHFPDKHMVESRGLLNWAKYNRKKIKAGTLPEEHGSSSNLLKPAAPPSTPVEEKRINKF